MATFNSFAGRAFVMPNPEEYYPTVNEFLGRTSPAGKIGASRATLLSSAKAVSRESVSTPVAFVGNFPVMTDDRNTISWANACGASL
jgi:hypothetical protein